LAAPNVIFPTTDGVLLTPDNLLSLRATLLQQSLGQLGENSAVMEVVELE